MFTTPEGTIDRWKPYELTEEELAKVTGAGDDDDDDDDCDDDDDDDDHHHHHHHRRHRYYHDSGVVIGIGLIL